MRRAITTLAYALALTTLSVAACTATGGVPITASLALEPASNGRVTTASGWAVTLEEATVLVGPVYAYAPFDEPMAALALLPVARAHGGFDPLDGRLVRAEYLEQAAFSVLDGPVALGPIPGLRGAVDELSVVLDEPRGENARADGPTRGHHAYVRGVATRDDVSVPFEGTLDLEDEGLVRRVDGVPVDGPSLVEGTALVVVVDPAAWLDEANFEELVGGSPTLDPATQAHRAWHLGIRSARAWSARTEER